MDIMIFTFRPIHWIAASLLALAAVSCAFNSPQETAYNAFLNRIAADCDPLIIGSDNLGQAIVNNGLGANNDNYTTFLRATEALYEGSMSPAVYRKSLSGDMGGGTYNEHSFNCIVAHLPENRAGARAQPASPGK
ncbi:MAG TPA: hypothetical protein VIW72_03130 [Burkholderiales bacterium]